MTTTSITTLAASTIARFYQVPQLITNQKRFLAKASSIHSGHASHASPSFITSIHASLPSSGLLPPSPAKHRSTLNINKRNHRYIHNEKIVTEQTSLDINVKKDDNRDERNNSQKDVIYLHIAPCGDFWTGTSIFAAKHLQPDYVRSIALPNELENAEILEEILECEGDKLLQDIYDAKSLPLNFGEIMKKYVEEKKDS